MADDSSFALNILVGSNLGGSSKQPKKKSSFRQRQQQKRQQQKQKLSVVEKSKENTGSRLSSTKHKAAPFNAATGSASSWAPAFLPGKKRQRSDSHDAKGGESVEKPASTAFVAKIPAMLNRAKEAVEEQILTQVEAQQQQEKTPYMPEKKRGENQMLTSITDGGKKGKKPKETSSSVDSTSFLEVSAMYSQRATEAGQTQGDQQSMKNKNHKSEVVCENKISTFEEIGLHPKLVTLLKGPKQGRSGRGVGFGFIRPTEVQKRAIPLLLNAGKERRGRDVLIKSETGSGKTLTYLLPILQSLVDVEPSLTRSDGLRALILAPTRELCQQINSVLALLVQPFIRIVPGIVSGGESRKKEKARLRKGINLLVATPGRLLDHLQNTKSLLRSSSSSSCGIKWIVLDEADLLLDLGFEKQIREVLRLIREDYEFTHKKKQAHDTAKLEVRHLLLSATMNENIRKLCKDILFEPVYMDADELRGSGGGNGHGVEHEVQGGEDTVKVFNSEGEHNTNGEDKFVTPERLAQYFMVVPMKNRLTSLMCFLRQQFLLASPTTQNRNPEKGQKSAESRPGCKVIVFFSTCDAVDFFFELFSTVTWPGANNAGANGILGVPETKEKVQVSAGEGDISSEDSDVEVSSPATTALRKENTIAAPPASPPLLFRLHGNIAQSDRTKTFQEFSNVTSGVLFCTDVAARGLHLPTVHWIVQYDPPIETRDYVHRVGRTARSGTSGQSLIFLLPSEVLPYLQVLSSHGLDTAKMTPLPLDETIAAAITTSTSPGESENKSVSTFLQASSVSGQKQWNLYRKAFPAATAAGGGKKERDVERKARSQKLAEVTHSELQFLVEETILGKARDGKKSPIFTEKDSSNRRQKDKETPDTASAHLLESARKAFTSFVRSYATHSSESKHVFNVRGLHLGHVAKSFGLREAPSIVSGTMSKARKDATDHARKGGKRKIGKQYGDREKKSKQLKFSSSISGDSASKGDAESRRVGVAKKMKIAQLSEFGS